MGARTTTGVLPHFCQSALVSHKLRRRALLLNSLLPQWPCLSLSLSTGLVPTVFACHGRDQGVKTFSSPSPFFLPFPHRRRKKTTPKFQGPGPKLHFTPEFGDLAPKTTVYPILWSTGDWVFQGPLLLMASYRTCMVPNEFSKEEEESMRQTCCIPNQ